jgi:Protein of unknown function, DUF255
MRQAYYLVAVVLFLGQPALAEPNPTKPTNRLALESSPYLLQHAHNPVNWYPCPQRRQARVSVDRL